MASYEWRVFAHANQPQRIHSHMEVYHAKLSRAQLTAMPETERVLLLLLAHASNEINVLT
jgi:hypothetical protein